MDTVFNVGVWGLIFFTLVIKFIRSIRLVPTRRAYIVERLGKYSKTLGPGFHALLPFIENVAHIQDLKEETIDVEPQDCFTLDNVMVKVDGVMYISVTDPVKASYGITDYREASIQLAQTTIRAEIGKMDLDKTFEERALLSAKVVDVLTDAAANWGIHVHRYEIKNIVPPPTVKDSMEKEASAEREKRAIIAKAEGERQSQINRSEGVKMEMINKSEGRKLQQINEAEGKANEIRSIANATAASIEQLGQVLKDEIGTEAMHLQLSQQLLQKYRNLAKGKTQVILPTNLSSLKEILESLKA